MTKPKSHGGARENSGRPPKPKNEKLKRTSVTLTPELREKLRTTAKARKTTEAALVREALTEFFKAK